MPVSENLLKLQKVYKYLLNQVPIEELLQMAGLRTVLQYLPNAEKLKQQFLQTWATQMAPLFGSSAL